MKLNNVTLVGEQAAKTIGIRNEIIESISFGSGSQDNSIEFENAIAFPGLINSHDHLDFNCFPMLGNRKYRNYAEWGADIHKSDPDTIAAVLRIPEEVKVRWGVYKNLLNGFTTVVNHGPKLIADNDLIDVFQQCNSIHSVQLQKNWRISLNHPFRNRQPYVIHVGEGTDDAAFKEVDTLLRWNLLNRPLIGIHAVAMKQPQASKFKALIWCPYSNDFLLGAMAPIPDLKEKTVILFGTDSCVSSSWNLWDHLQLAKKTGFASDEELFAMLTSNPAAIWKLHDRGQLREGMNADIVIAKNKNPANSLGAFFDLQPEDILLVIHKGEPLLFDDTLKEQLQKNARLENYSMVKRNGKTKFIKGNLPELMKEIKSFYPGCLFPFEA